MSFKTIGGKMNWFGLDINPMGFVWLGNGKVRIYYGYRNKEDIKNE